MPKKVINVKKGQISLMVPEDIPKLYETMQNIFNMTKTSQMIITKENEYEVDMELRKNSSRDFEDLFGKGSCEKTFGTKLPSYKAFAEFAEKINDLIEQWDLEQ